MVDFSKELSALLHSPHAPWLDTLAPQLTAFKNNPHGNLKRWQRILTQLPELTARHVALSDTVQVGSPNEASDADRARLTGLLQQLQPWRKGPFNLFGVSIDTEWRSDWKWQRVAPHLDDLSGRQVLDVGCGSGYHLWRMLEAGADTVWGIDPGELFLMQFRAIRQLMPLAWQQRAHFFPVGIEHMPELKSFDTVFSMGVLYHRRSPVEFLQQLKSLIRPGGQLVLETIVVEGDETTVMMPGERYAQMRNVWFLPSARALSVWLERLGFTDICVVDHNTTSTEEQRRTDWMTGESLANFLDPNDATKTIEGYQAPIRAVITARV
ncbi:tRNA 5-methoxyuridine(34)/uridine 5-oxyacetic acid(34) synthase CmoB [Idiomarina ramblicola]|uniref:tRNA U34 carboxymethyltransferase n=1 Tax=Idiomarina ramblicola TaxID=263724 RepID=A0A432YV63_9GAMM|nr:tRNA 5-methoxyuridine(34)/uridine 5-oxyacetic acid(34) synthase CmoB [Idiomarina ramblicola]RUO67202.1 tRNA 5-methoxyuridine(34)/uridine 5-oxyacetic acid(34) synthase CmoB [Idiomarina ramblicola]